MTVAIGSAFAVAAPSGLINQISVSGTANGCTSLSVEIECISTGGTTPFGSAYCFVNSGQWTAVVYLQAGATGCPCGDKDHPVRIKASAQQNPGDSDVTTVTLDCPKTCASIRNLQLDGAGPCFVLGQT